jgi:hypothetical protein
VNVTRAKVLWFVSVRRGDWRRWRRYTGRLGVRRRRFRGVTFLVRRSGIVGTLWGLYNEFRLFISQLDCHEDDEYCTVVLVSGGG